MQVVLDSKYLGLVWQWRESKSLTDWGPIIDKLVIVSQIYFSSHHRNGEMQTNVIARFQAITDKIRKLGS